MASGRMINNKITRDIRIHQLSDDTSRLAFTWLITFADSEGRTYGDPAIVRSMLFPRRDDIHLDQMTAYIQEWHDLGLIDWYQTDGDLFISFPAFLKNQKGMRPEREAASVIPPKDLTALDINTEQLRSNSDNSPEQVLNKLKEIKLKEYNYGGNGGGWIFTLYENNIGMMNPIMVDVLTAAESDYKREWIEAAVRIAIKNNVRKWNYVEGILKQWQADGKMSILTKAEKAAAINPEDLASEVY